MEESKRAYIIDSSFILAHLLPDEHVITVDNLFSLYKTAAIILYAPPLLPVEVANGLFAAHLSKRISSETACLLLERFLLFQILPLPISYKEVLVLALEKNFSVYDATYAYLAKKERKPLLTLDKKLQKISTLSEAT